MTPINFKLIIWRGLKLNVGSRKILWPTLIGLFSVAREDMSTYILTWTPYNMNVCKQNIEYYNYLQVQCLKGTPRFFCFAHNCNLYFTMWCRGYAKFTGWWMLSIILVSTTLMQATENGGDFWLSYWVDHVTDTSHPTSFYLVSFHSNHILSCHQCILDIIR